MIYLDCAATSLQKPPEVARAVGQAMMTCASPGRGNHPASARAAQVLFQCRETAAELFGASKPEQVVFTSNATHGLNIAIRSLVPAGSRVVISGYEHNAVTRTLASLPEVEVVTAVGGLFDRIGDVEAFRRLVDGHTSAVICTHVSNVFGYILPVDEIAEICREKGVPLIVDASQSAGVLPVSMKRWKASAIAMPGHKGLCGPQGTGLLIWSDEANAKPLLTGGTGSESRIQTMPDFLPDRLEAGTQNVAGVAGLLAGLRFVRRLGPERILLHEQALGRQLRAGLAAIHGVDVLAPGNAEQSTGVVSFRIDGMECEQAAEALAQKGFALRAGLHCAPLAHRTAETLETGTIRASISPFNREWEIWALVEAIRKMRKT